jgi:superoxide dismutase, Cu-Zn family
MKRIQGIGEVLVAAGLVAFAGCATGSRSTESDSTASQMSKTRQTAIAVLSPGTNGVTRGTVTFAEETEGVRVTASVEGLTPGLHGFHIHDKGDCSAPDFNSAGGHFNPTQAPHGSPTDPQHHAGDFGNLEANQQGIARYERVFNWLSFKGTNSIIGRAVIVHEKPDDLKTQPTGNAGGRLACGVIQSTR